MDIMGQDQELGRMKMKLVKKTLWLSLSSVSVYVSVSVFAVRKQRPEK